VKIIQKAVVALYVQYEELEVPLYDVMDTISELYNSEYGVQHVVIHDPKVADFLERLSAATKTGRGSYVKGMADLSMLSYKLGALTAEVPTKTAVLVE